MGTRDLKHLRAGSRGSGEPKRPDSGVSDQNRAGDPRRRRLAVVEVVGRERGQVEERRPGVEQSGDVTLLDSNVHAGLKYIRFMIDEHYAKEPMTPVDKKLFAFASYNAGPTRIERLRREAERRGLDRNVWFNVAAASTRIGEPERSAIRPHAVGAISATSGDIVTTAPTSVAFSPALSLR